jgi:ssDNA-specific exonuclease RecJ
MNKNSRYKLRQKRIKNRREILYKYYKEITDFLVKENLKNE